MPSHTIGSIAGCTRPNGRGASARRRCLDHICAFFLNETWKDQTKSIKARNGKGRARTTSFFTSLPPSDLLWIARVENEDEDVVDDLVEHANVVSSVSALSRQYGSDEWAVRVWRPKSHGPSTLPHRMPDSLNCHAYSASITDDRFYNLKFVLGKLRFANGQTRGLGELRLPSSVY